MATVTDAEDIGIRSASEFHRVDLKHVDRRATARLKIAEGDIRIAHAANAVGGEWIVLGVIGRGAVTVEREIGERRRALGAGLVGEDVVHVEQRQVHHLLFGDDRDRGGNVLELRVHAGARHRICTIVARVLF